VAAVAQALQEADPAVVVKAIEARFPWAGDDISRDYYAGYFEQLREAYRAAVSAGAGLAVLLC
jgi:hypothetical protein